MVEDERQFAPGGEFLQLLWLSWERRLSRPCWGSCCWPQWPHSGRRAGRVEKVEDIELVEELVEDVDERSLPVRSPTAEEQIHQEQRVSHVCIKFLGLIKIFSHPSICRQTELQVQAVRV